MPEPLDPEALFRVLARHQVRYVLIGGLAAVLHGSSALTNDADICPERSPANLERLAAALREMGARIRASAEPDGLPFDCDAMLLARMKMVNLSTRHGDFDLSFEPAASAGYEDLVARAIPFDIGGTQVLVASLADIIRSKEAADRPKDRATLPILRALEDEIARQSGEA